MESHFVDFPQSIKDAAEVVAREGTIKESGAYPISWSVTGIAAPSVNAIIVELSIKSDCKLSGIFYDNYIINAAAVLRKPTAARIEFNTNPLSTVSKIGQSQFTGLGGATLVPQYLRYNLPNEMALIDTELHPMTIPAGSVFRVTLSIYDPAIIATDFVNSQLTLVFKNV